MARERRDSGKPTLQARWYGDIPIVGDFLCSQLRPRAAYKITGVRVTSTGNDELAGTYSALVLACEIVQLGDVPADAKVHPWRWDSRQKRGVSWG